jgi:hypothetical protein
MSLDHLLSTHEIARRAGASYRQIDYWTEAAVLVPAIWLAGNEPATVNAGSGHRRRYRTETAYLARACQVLSDHRATSAVMAVLARAIEANPDLWVEEMVYVGSDETVSVKPTGGWAVPLAECREYVDAVAEAEEGEAASR